MPGLKHGKGRYSKYYNKGGQAVPGMYRRGGSLPKAQSLGELKEMAEDEGYDVDAGVKNYMQTGDLNSAVTTAGGDSDDAAMIDQGAQDMYGVDLTPEQNPGTSAMTIGHADYGQHEAVHVPQDGMLGNPTPYAQPGYNYMTPTPGGTEDTTRIGDRFMRRAARKEGRNLMREMRQERRRDRREERQARKADRRQNRIDSRQERRDARHDARMDRRTNRQEKKMGRIDARSERQEARQQRRADRQFNSRSRRDARIR